MDEKMVRVEVRSNSGGPEFKMVPLSEVPTGYILTSLVGFGDAYTDPKAMKPSLKYRHSAFPEPVRDILRQQVAALAKILPHSVEAWEDGFRADMHPWTEIAIHGRVIRGMEQFAAHLVGDDEMTKQKRRDIIMILYSLTNDGPTPKGYARTPPATLTPKRLAAIEAWMFSDPVVSAMRQQADELRNLIMPNKLAGPERVNISALFGEGNDLNTSSEFRPRELIASADVIFAVDTDTSQEVLVYGRNFLQRVDRGEVELNRVLHVELDADTSDFARLCVLVEVLKGSHDYQPND